MDDQIKSIFSELKAIEKRVEKGDCSDIRSEIHLLGRIAERFFKKSSYEELIADADEQNEDLIEKGRWSEDDEEHIKSLIFMAIET